MNERRVWRLIRFRLVSDKVRKKSIGSKARELRSVRPISYSLLFRCRRMLVWHLLQSIGVNRTGDRSLFLKYNMPLAIMMTAAIVAIAIYNRSPPRNGS